ncbi:hypothetical protein Dimus_032956 [Dionaea muscipula]
MSGKYAMTTSRGSGRRYLKDEDFEEGDVWGVMENNSSPKMRKFKDSSSSSYYSSSSSSSATWCLPSASRLVPRATNNPTKEANPQASAPMEIPDRRKNNISTRSKKNVVGSKGTTDQDGSWAYYDGHGSSDYGDHDGNDGDDEDEDHHEVEEEMVPPHEYIARRLARSQISSFSVCEGVGRTLKGRDLSQVRNAILRRTGFLES